jgi:hypothetical protein
MLSLDHIQSDGAEHRREIPGPMEIYLFCKKNGIPEGFQTLCHNHQWKKEILRRREQRK